MKKIISTTLLVLFALGICFSQDVITKKSGDEIQAKISEITTTQVKYNRFDNLNGPVYSIDLSDVLMIKYDNGTKGLSNTSNMTQPPEGKKISLCNFELNTSSATSSVSAISPLAGAIYATARDPHDRPYFERLKDTLIQITESMLKEAMIFQYIPKEKIQTNPSETRVTPDVVAKNNDLFACLSVTAALACKMGWKKKIVIYTQWQIRCSSKYKVKIATSDVSKDAKAVFVDISDPKYLPDWIELIKANTRQFLEKISVLMKKDKNMQ